MITVIFDIDGVLADCTHRLHHILVPGRKQDWDAFDALTHKDTPIPASVWLLNILRHRAKIVLLTGRSERVRKATEEWLHVNGIKYDELLMRASGDRRKAAYVKTDIMNEHNLTADNVMCIFEDEPATITILRAKGHTVYNPADWGENYYESTQGGPE